MSGILTGIATIIGATLGILFLIAAIMRLASCA